MLCFGGASVRGLLDVLVLPGLQGRQLGNILPSDASNFLEIFRVTLEYCLDSFNGRNLGPGTGSVSPPAMASRTSQGWTEALSGRKVGSRKSAKRKGQAGIFVL